ncbi:hypothetical protein RND81_01G209700 [Saponaria officinalis]|uniref:Defensin-like protein n=1 Tax=Saponaria officinalis TaxID=3572 RepID=A0AAW1NGZ3_SAPOF
MAHFKFHVLLIFVLLAFETMKIEAQCIDPLGECGPAGECDKRCKEKHPDGGGECNFGMCQCVYGCEPPKPPEPKICTSNDGLCPKGCDNNCCTANCKTKWPTATGQCQRMISTEYVLCLCSWEC